MYDPMKDFFLNQTEDVVTPWERYHITEVALFADGDFDGCTVKIEVCPTIAMPEVGETRIFDHPNGTYTAAGEEKFWNNADLAEVWVRGRLDNAGPGTNVNFSMRPRLAVGH